MWKAVVLVLALMTPACAPSRDGAAVAPQHEETRAAVRQLGSWSGKGNTTLGFVSESGSFRIVWKTQNQDSRGRSADAAKRH
jgi:outer membrane biogenesis lipoprotein LolB